MIRRPYLSHHLTIYPCLRGIARLFTFATSTYPFTCVQACCSVQACRHVCVLHLSNFGVLLCSGGAAASEGRRGRSAVRLFTWSVLLCVQVEQQRQKDAADGLFNCSPGLFCYVQVEQQRQKDAADGLCCSPVHPVCSAVCSGAAAASEGRRGRSVLFACSPGLFCCVFRWSSSVRRTPRTVCSPVHLVCFAVCSGGAAASEGRRGRSVHLFTRSVLLCSGGAAASEGRRGRSADRCRPGRLRAPEGDQTDGHDHRVRGDALWCPTADRQTAQRWANGGGIGRRALSSPRSAGSVGISVGKHPVLRSNQLFVVGTLRGTKICDLNIYHS